MLKKNATSAITAVGGNTGAVRLQGKFNLILGGTFAGTFKLLKRYKDDVSIGVQDGGDGQSLFTDSSGIDYAIDELIGTWVSNDTDGSFAPVTDNSTTTITGTLIGGTDTDWDDDDVASIWEEVAEYTAAQDLTIEEPEQGVDYMILCTVYTSGTARVRLSN